MGGDFDNRLQWLAAAWLLSSMAEDDDPLGDRLQLAPVNVIDGGFRDTRVAAANDESFAACLIAAIIIILRSIHAKTSANFSKPAHFSHLLTPPFS
jgi:hypothetical protein